MRQATGACQGTTGVDWGHGTYGGRISAGPLSSCLACNRNRVVVANPLPSRVWDTRLGGRPRRRRGGGDDPLRTVYKVLTQPGWNLRRRWNRLVGTRSSEMAIGWGGEDHTAAVPHGSNPARPREGIHESARSLGIGHPGSSLIRGLSGTWRRIHAGRCPWQLHPGTGHDGTDHCGALDVCRPNRTDRCTRLPPTRGSCGCGAGSGRTSGSAWV